MRVEAGVKVVTKLKCQVCTKFGERILGRRNFSDKCIQGTDSVQTTSIFDHVKSNQHVHVMNLLVAKEQGASIVSYAPIAK